MTAHKKSNHSKTAAKKTAPKETTTIKKSPVTGNFKYLPQLLIFVVSFILYANTLTHEYALDDRLVLSENKFTLKGLSGIGDIFSNDQFVGFYGEDKNLLPGGRFRPLSQITFAAEYEFFGLTPSVSHLMNVLLYSLLTLLLYSVLKLLILEKKKSKWYLTLPFITTVLFMAHPIHTEVVANIKGRDEIMTLMGVLGALWFYLKYTDEKKILHLVLGSVCFLLGLLSKESAVTFLVIIPAAMYVFDRGKQKEILFSFLGMLSAVAIFFLLRDYALGFMFTSGKTVEQELLNDPYLESTLSEKFATIFYTLWLYIQLLFYPHPLTHDYYPKQIPIIEFSDMRAILPLILYIALGIFAIWGVIKKNKVAFGVFLYLASFSIVSNVVFNVGTFMNERFMFVPSLGFSLIIAWYLIKACEKFFPNSSSTAKIFLMAVFLLGYSIKTISRNPAWKDDFTLFTTDVKTSVNSAKCNVSAGGMLYEKSLKEKDSVTQYQLREQAIVYIEKGVSIHPKYFAGWMLYGNCFLYQKRYEEAYTCFDNCLRLNPRHKDIYTNLFFLAQKATDRKDFSPALKAYDKLISENPDSLDYVQGKAVTFEMMGRLDDAIALLKNLVQRHPTYYKAYNLLGEIYGKQKNDLNASFEFLMKAYNINPNFASTLENIGVVYGIRKQYKESIEMFERALKINPKNVQTYLNIASSYRNFGDDAKALEYEAKAQQIKNQPK
ncbi:MAG: tetratricopeptide repeat protein [Bacteroidota bacterium]